MVFDSICTNKYLFFVKLGEKTILFFEIKSLNQAKKENCYICLAKLLKDIVLWFIKNH